MIIRLTQVELEWVGDGTEQRERPISIMADKIKTWAPKVLEDQEVVLTEMTFIDQETIYVRETPAEVDAAVLLLDDHRE